MTTYTNWCWIKLGDNFIDHSAKGLAQALAMTPHDQQPAHLLVDDCSLTAGVDHC